MGARQFFIRNGGGSALELAARFGIRRKRPFLLVGHPRSGTGYAAALLRRWGLDVGHERVGAHGVSAWYAGCEGTPPLCEPVPWGAYDFEHVVHVVRRARPTVLSVAFTETATERYRFRHLGLELTNDRVHDAIVSVEAWTDLLRRRFAIDHVFRIESDSEPLYAFVREHAKVGPYQPLESRVNSRRTMYASMDPDELLAPYADRLAALDARLGYTD